VLRLSSVPRQRLSTTLGWSRQPRGGPVGLSTRVVQDDVSIIIGARPQCALLRVVIDLDERTETGGHAKEKAKKTTANQAQYRQSG